MMNRSRAAKQASRSLPLASRGSVFRFLPGTGNKPEQALGVTFSKNSLLGGSLKQTFEKEASAGDLDLLKDGLKETLPSFLMSCLDTSAQGWIPFADWKKDPLVQVLAAVRVVEEKVKEKNHWAEWNDCLHSLLDSVINPDDDPSGNKVEAFNVDFEGDGTSSFPQASASSNKIHWEAQRTAAFASWALLGLYVGSSDATSFLSSPNSALSDLGSCFQDSGISTLRVQKKKMIMQVSPVRGISTP